jgi:hypothetical protein
LSCRSPNAIRSTPWLPDDPFTLQTLALQEGLAENRAQTDLQILSHDLPAIAFIPSPTATVHLNLPATWTPTFTLLPTDTHTPEPTATDFPTSTLFTLLTQPPDLHQPSFRHIYETRLEALITSTTCTTRKKAATGWGWAGRWST